MISINNKHFNEKSIASIELDFVPGKPGNPAHFIFEYNGGSERFRQSLFAQGKVKDTDGIAIINKQALLTYWEANK